MSIGEQFSPDKQRGFERFLTRNLIPINEKYNTIKSELNEKFNTFNEKYFVFSLNSCIFAAEINQRTYETETTTDSRPPRTHQPRPA